MVNKISCGILNACFFFALFPPMASAGVEPSPFFPDIGDIYDQIILVGQKFTQPGAIPDSLTAFKHRLETISQDLHLKSGNPQQLEIQGSSLLKRISVNLIDSEGSVLPDDECLMLITIMDRILSIVFDPQPEPPGYIAQGFNVMDRLLSILFDPQPEPPGIIAQGLNVMDCISSILFDPQPEPPGFIAQGFNVLDRTSWVLIPQPGLLTLTRNLQALLISIMYEVADVMERTFISGIPHGTIPGLNALEKLSGHLVDAVIKKQSAKAAAQLNAMFQITEQYADY